jgi:hypothetical protein
MILFAVRFENSFPHQPETDQGVFSSSPAASAAARMEHAGGHLRQRCIEIMACQSMRALYYFDRLCRAV